MIIFSDFRFFKTIGYRVANLLSLRNIFGYYARNIIVYVSEYLKLFIYRTNYIICDSNCCIPCNRCYRSAKNQCAANNSTKENEIIDKCDSTSVVGENSWVVKAIGKHICAKDALTGACISVWVYEPTNFRSVVPRLEIVQTCLGIVEVAPIPQRVYICHITRRSKQFAPSVVSVCGSFSTGCGYDLENVALKVLDVEVFCVSAVRGSGEAYHIACAVIVEVKGVCVGNVRSKLAALPDVAVSYAVDGLACAQTGLVIGKAKRIAAFGHGGQLSAALPAHSPAAVAQRVAYTVIAYGLAVVCGQQVAPLSVAIGVECFLLNRHTVRAVDGSVAVAEAHYGRCRRDRRVDGDRFTGRLWSRFGCRSRRRYRRRCRRGSRRRVWFRFRLRNRSRFRFGFWRRFGFRCLGGVFADFLDEIAAVIVGVTNYYLIVAGAYRLGYELAEIIILICCGLSTGDGEYISVGVVSVVEVSSLAAVGVRDRLDLSSGICAVNVAVGVAGTEDGAAAVLDRRPGAAAMTVIGYLLGDVTVAKRGRTAVVVIGVGIAEALAAYALGQRRDIVLRIHMSS